ncbi:MAG: hypothetical protein Tsb0021_11820 [Chlamydiales bacterium]
MLRICLFLGASEWIRREYFGRGNSKEFAAKKDFADFSAKQALRASKSETLVNNPNFGFISP